MKTIKKVLGFILEGLVFVLFFLKFIFIACLYWLSILLLNIIGWIIWVIEGMINLLKRRRKRKTYQRR